MRERGERPHFIPFLTYFFEEVDVLQGKPTKAKTSETDHKQQSINTPLKAVNGKRNKNSLIIKQN